jgi:uracil-DNA glycosylase
VNVAASLAMVLQEVRACRVCAELLPLGPRPVLRAESTARILIIGQAPGTRVHETGIPWDDASGERLRAWLGIDREVFYHAARIAIIPMGLCYPGKGGGGDLPPRPECAPLWHARLLRELPRITLTLLIGQYAQKYYLGDARRENLTETVRHGVDYAPRLFPLPHPSPRNLRWLARNPWFERERVPALRERVAELLNSA